MVDAVADIFAQRGPRDGGQQRQQADRPVGRDLHPAGAGTAPGLICPVGDKVDLRGARVCPTRWRTCSSAPSSPTSSAVPARPPIIRSRVLRTWGLAESTLAEIVAPQVRRSSRASPARRRSPSSRRGMEGIKVRVTVKAADGVEPPTPRSTPRRASCGRCSATWCSAIDDDSMESVVGSLLARMRGLTLGVAESLTGGLIGSRLTEVAGASSVVPRVGGLLRVRRQARGARTCPTGPSCRRRRRRRWPTGAARVLGASRRARRDRRGRSHRAGRDAGGHRVLRRRHRRDARGVGAPLPGRSGAGPLVLDHHGARSPPARPCSAPRARRLRNATRTDAERDLHGRRCRRRASTPRPRRRRRVVPSTAARASSGPSARRAQVVQHGVGRDPRAHRTRSAATSARTATTPPWRMPQRLRRSSRIVSL